MSARMTRSDGSDFLMSDFGAAYWITDKIEVSKGIEISYSLLDDILTSKEIRHQR
jgi:hypothetical protein